jgi:AcrR family transcriptional regulator
MARPPTITHEQILAAAREVFLAKGIRATVAEVAERAGVAGGSIFNRFPSKEDLFCAAMIADPDGEPPWFELVRQAQAATDVKATLIEIGGQLIAFFRQIMPLMMMAWSNAGASGVPQQFEQPDPMPLRGLRTITELFEAQMRAGRIMRCDPLIAARAFLGGIQNFVFFELVMRAQNQPPLPEERFLRGLVDVLWRGLEPKARTAGRATKRQRSERSGRSRKKRVR